MMKKTVFFFLILLFCGLLESQNSSNRGTFKIKRNAIFAFDQGLSLFYSNCFNCHTPYAYDKDERPYITYLEGVTKARSPNWLFSFIRYPELLAQSGDTSIVRINKKVKRIYELYDRSPQYPMPIKHASYHHLSLSEINAIFFYIDSLSVRKNNFDKGILIDGHK